MNLDSMTDLDDLELDHELLEIVIKKLIDDSDSKKAWKILQNIALHLPQFDDLLAKSRVEIPLLNALNVGDTSEIFINKLVERLHWKQIDNNCMESLIKKSFFDTAAKIIIKKGMDRNIMDPPLVIATEWVIRKGNNIE